MSLKRLHLKIALVGVLMPYVARLPRGIEWVQQYTNVGLMGNLFLGALNAIPWGCMIAASSVFRDKRLVVFPCAFGFAALAWGHYSLDLKSDSTAAIALVIIPVYATMAVGIGTGLGLAIDWLKARREA